MSDNGQNTDDVYERVRTAILDRELAAGAVMSQVALAAPRRARGLMAEMAHYAEAKDYRRRVVPHQRGFAREPPSAHGTRGF